jgi:hypothetical protein
MHFISMLISKLSRFSGPTPSHGPCNGFACIKSIIFFVLSHINNRYTDSSFLSSEFTDVHRNAKRVNLHKWDLKNFNPLI